MTMPPYDELLPVRDFTRFIGNGTVKTGQPAVRTTFSAVVPKKIFSTPPTAPP
jgi:hypothetical protein